MLVSFSPKLFNDKFKFKSYKLSKFSKQYPNYFKPLVYCPKLLSIKLNYNVYKFFNFFIP